MRRLRPGLLTITCCLLLATLFGLPSMAFAADGNIEGNNDVYLTKVISIKDGIKVVDDNKVDTYTFHFAGYGSVTQVDGKLVSGDENESVEQDNSLNVGWTVPKLGDENGDVTIEAADVPTTSDYEISEGSGTYVGAVHASLKSIVSSVSFANPGIYTYRVTEKAVTKAASGAGVAVTQSQASYLMKVKVLRNESTNEIAPTDIVVLKEIDDEGNPNGNVYIQQSRKVDPTYPKLVENTTQIDRDQVPNGIDLGPDARGFHVYGFTFTNEYITGMAFSVKKEVSGQMASATQEFPISVIFTDQAAPAGCRYVYSVFDKDGNEISERRNAATFNESKTAQLNESISHGQYIKVIGLQGTFNVEGDTDPDDSTNYTPENPKRTWFNNGLVPSTTYNVIESATKNYQGTIITFNSDYPETISNSTTGETRTQVATGIAGREVGTGALSTDGAAKTVLIVNTYDETNTSFTGIIMNNLPYILMIGIPLGLITIKVVGRLRAGEEAA